MTNLELMEKATSFTTEAYINLHRKEKEGASDLENDAIAYSGSALMNVLYSSTGLCADYTRRDNLRQNVASLGKDAIRSELLKNVVSVAAYNIMNRTWSGRHLGQEAKPGMYDEQIAVAIFNGMAENGVEKGYQMLSDPNTLASVCRTFVKYRRQGKKEALDNLAQTNQAVVYLHDQLDGWYAKYGDKPNETRGYLY